MQDLQDAKRLVRGFYVALDAAKGPNIGQTLKQFCSEKLLLYRGSHPFHEQPGPEAFGDVFWMPLKLSPRYLQRRLALFFAGRNDIDGFQSVCVASMGHHRPSLPSWRSHCASIIGLGCLSG